MLNHRDDARGGFTVIELMIALAVLALAVLGVAGSTSRLSVQATTAETHSMALKAVDDQITRVSVDPRYERLDSLYEGTETVLPGMPGYQRVTTLDDVQVALSADNSVTYRRLTVRVSGPGLREEVARTVVLAAP